MLLALVLSISMIVGFATINADSVAYASSDVAAVTFNEETTYYTSLVAALSYANTQSSSAVSQTEVKLLDNVLLAEYLEVKAEKILLP